MSDPALPKSASSELVALNALSTAASSVPALLLWVGDPVPPLHVVPPLSLDALTGQWSLLVSCDAARVPKLAEIVAGLGAADNARRCTIIGLSRGMADVTPWEGAGDVVLHGDADGAAADALGALAGPRGRADLVVLLDPRLDVQLAARWCDTATLVAALCDVWQR